MSAFQFHVILCKNKANHVFSSIFYVFYCLIHMEMVNLTCEKEDYTCDI